MASILVRAEVEHVLLDERDVDPRGHMAYHVPVAMDGDEIVANLEEMMMVEEEAFWEDYSEVHASAYWALAAAVAVLRKVPSTVAFVEVPA